MNVPSKNRADLLRLAARMAEEAELIGSRMAERRGELDLTQREVAERMAGSTQGSDVSRWERGKHRPEPLAEIAKALETTVADLISGPLADRKEPETISPGTDLFESLRPDPSLAEVAGAVDALMTEMVATRTQLLARIERAQQETEALLQKQAPRVSRPKSTRK